MAFRQQRHMHSRLTRRFVAGCTIEPQCRSMESTSGQQACYAMIISNITYTSLTSIGLCYGWTPLRAQPSHVLGDAQRMLIWTDYQGGPYASPSNNIHNLEPEYTDLVGYTLGCGVETAMHSPGGKLKLQGRSDPCVADPCQAHDQYAR